MTTPHRTLQMALDALDAITDDVDGTGLNTMPSFDKAIDAIAALREALAPDHLRDVAEKAAPAEDFCYCDDDISLQMVSGGAALEGLYGRVTLKINGQYVDYVKAQPAPAEPVALESVHLTRDINGMCTVRVNGRVAIQDNGDIIDHMATLEWFAQPAPVPLTDTETHAELWKLAVRKGLVTVRSELIDPRNHGTRVSWMQGHDKACDISNEAAAHGIAASPAAPAAPVVPLTDERITKALRRAFSLGQTYWQQADSDSYKQNAKSDETRQKFETLIVETLFGITGGSK
jgi:hypothetical protein